MDFVLSDYVTARQIADAMNVSTETARRWIRNFADRSVIKIHDGRYWLHKDEFERWKAAYGDKSPIPGLRVPFSNQRRG